MSKKKSAKRVPLPNINATAATDFANREKSSLNALTANRADQVNPYGSIDWSRDPTTGEWTQKESYNPAQQGLLDTQVATQGILGAKGQQVASGLDAGYANAPGLPTAGGANERALAAIRALQAPDLARRRAAKEAQLTAMGVGTGTGSAWNTEQQNIGDAESRADLGAITNSFDVGRGMFADDITARNTYTGEQDRALRNVGGMMSGAAPAPLAFGSYGQTAPVAPVDTTANALKMWEMQQAQENAKAAANKGGLMGGLGTVAGGIIGGIYGGVPGAQAGASIGGSAGGLFDR